jgi:hypothetical protein
MLIEPQLILELALLGIATGSAGPGIGGRHADGSILTIILTSNTPATTR